MGRRRRGWTAALLAAAALVGGCTSADDPFAGPTPPTTGRASPSTAATGTPEPDDGFVLGALLPRSGPLAALGRVQAAAVDAAVAEIDKAGGVQGRPVTKVVADVADTRGLTGVLQRLLDHQPDVVVDGSPSTPPRVTDRLLDARVVQIAPVQTALDLTPPPPVASPSEAPTSTPGSDPGTRYFRTGASYALEGRVLANLVLDDEAARLAILASRSEASTLLANQAADSFHSALGEVAERVDYDPGTTDFAALVEQVRAARPDAIAIVGGGETEKILAELVHQDVLPGLTKVYLVGSNLADYGDDLPKGALLGVKATSPGARTPGRLRQRLLEVDPQLAGQGNLQFAAETYDAVVLAALAAEAARSTDPAAIAGQLAAVSGGGEVCRDYDTCRRDIRRGRDVDYDGYSGALDLDDQGRPTVASVGLAEYGIDNTYDTYDYVVDRT